MKKDFWKRVLSGLTTISLLVNSLVPYGLAGTVYAQESTDSVALEATISSETPLSTESPTVTPLPDSTPAVTADPTPTPDVAATPTPTAEVTPTPSPQIIPSNLSPPTPTPTPAPTPDLSANPEDLRSLSERPKADFPKDLQTQKQNYVPGEVIVKFKREKLDVKSILGKVQAFVFEKKFSLSKTDEIKTSNIQVFKSKKYTEDLVKELKSDPAVEYAEPNYLRFPTTIGTNDTYKDSLWGLDNIGQTVNGVVGTNNADIDAPEAWNVSDGSGNIIVAIIDSGVAYNHPDLAVNMWDGSSCIDESGAPLGGCNHGYDFENNDKTPLPDSSSHGTHIAGIIAAAKNNSKGVIGVSPQAKIMALKYGSNVASEVKAIDFAIQNGAKVINASFAGNYYSQSEYDAINRFKNAGGIFIAAAGNESVNNNGGIPSYPSDYDLDNVISVAATDQNDSLASFSNYGATSVDVEAPGINIYSTIANSVISIETFDSVTLPNIPSGWIKGGTSNNWGTYSWGGLWGNVLYGDLAYPYASNSDTTITSTTYNLSTGGASMSFWAACDTEYITNGWADYMQLEYSPDGAIFTPAIDPFYPGENFRWDEPTFDVLNGDPSDPLIPANTAGGSVFYYENVSIPSQYLTNNFKFRFRWVSNSSDNNYDGCIVDDVQIDKYSDGSDEKYDYMQGTSMAAPHVAGLTALIWGYKPNLTPAQVKDRILQTGDSKTSLIGKTVSGKRINAYNALNGLNNAPTSIASSTSTNEDTAVTVTLSGSDIDGDSLTYSIVSNPTHGALGVIAGNTVSYTPNLNYFGNDAFTFKANDGIADSNISTVTVTVNPINDVPIANAGSATTLEDTLVNIALSGTDVDGNTLTYSIVSGVSHGVLSIITDNQLSYTPSSNFNGSDSFTFKVNDGTIDSAPATVSITVTSVNDAPVLNFIGNKTVNELINLTFTATATDPDSSLTFNLTGAPSGASILSDTGVFSFTPTEAQGPANYTLTVNVTDGVSIDSEEITITVNEANVAPIAQDGSASTNEDTVKTITLSATDSDLPANTLIYSIVSGVSHGVLGAISGNQITYTPNSDYNGADLFTFKANDGGSDSNTATISITVNPINDLPVITSSAPTTATEDTLYTYDANVSDPDGPSVTWSKTLSDTCGGTLDSSTGVYVFTPNGPVPPASCVLGIKVSDSGTPNLSATQTVTITIGTVNNAPVATADSYATNEDTTLNVLAPGVLANDSDADSPILSAILVSGVSHGILTFNTNGSFSYIPASNFNGPDSFAYKANDGSADSNTVTASIAVSSVNDAPVANSDTASIDEDTTLTISKSTLLSNDTDVEGDSLALTAVSNPVHGTVSISGDNVIFAPTANYNGSASFDYTVSDGILTDMATVLITVNPVNDAPSTTSITDKTINEDNTTGSLAFTIGDVDNAVGSLVVTGTSSNTSVVPVSGIVFGGSDASRTVIITPLTNQSGTTTITITISDGSFSASTSFILTVNPVNDAPVANSDASSVDEDTILTIAKSVLLANDTDVDGNTLTISSVSNPLHGSVSIVGDNVIFTPTLNYSGPASFDYTVSDGSLNNTTTVSITVNQVNDAPELDTIGNKNIDEFATLNFTISASDIDSQDLQFTTSSLPANASFDSVNKIFTFTPNESQGGQNYPVTFTVSDGILSDEETITISVNEVNSSPVAVNDTASVNEDEALTINTNTLLVNDYDLDTNTNAGLVITTANTGVNGTVDLVGTTITFTPNANFNGTASFSYIVSDGSLTDTGTVTVTVNPINDVPVLDPIGNKNVDEFSTLTINVNATDVDNANLTYSVGELPQNATFNPATKTFIFTPDESQGGTIYNVTFIVSDETLTDEETISITVNEVNNAPVAQNDQFVTNEDSAISISVTDLLANDSDPDNAHNELTVTAVSNPVHGTVLISSNNVIFTPSANYNGPASFDYTVSDGHLLSTATVSITVNPINDAPVANAGSVTTNEDTLVDIALSGTDIDENALTYSIVSGVSNGTLGEISGSHVSYTPSVNYNGSDSFIFKVNDGAVDSSSATITITITPVNDPPVLSLIGNKTVNELANLTFTATAIDPDSSLAYSLTNAPTGATIDATTGVFSFTPTETQGPGTYTLIVNVTDGVSIDSEEITITVNEVNTTPIATDGTSTTNEDTTKTITLNATDPDLPVNTLSYSIVSGVSHGILGTISENQLTYTPNANYNGSDSFTYKVNDGTADSLPATISLTISPMNDAPLTGDDTTSTDEDTTLTIAKSVLLANDSDADVGDSLNLINVSNPINGIVVISGSDVIFTPAANFNGTASFDYTISDGALTDTATVTITVNPVNDVPIADSQPVSTDEDTPVVISLSGSDIEGNTLTYSLVDAPSNGTLGALTDNTITYTPNSDFVGSNTFTFKVNDGEFDSNTATVSITVTAVNDPPVLASIGNQTINELTNLNFTVFATDPDSSLTYSVIGAPTGATITPTTGVFSFTPTEAQGPGDYTLTVSVTDGAATDSEEITITVNEVNTASVALDSSVSTNEDTSKTITLSATDSDLPANTLIYSIVSGVSHGVLGAISGNQITYTPSTDYNGGDSFTFKANDNTDDSNTATVTINISPANDAPVANSDTASINEDTTLTIAKSALLANDTDVDGDSLTLSSVSNPVSGTVSIVAGDVVFTPDTNYSGPASFDYTATDGSLTDTTTVSITVNPVNDAPVASDGVITTSQEVPVTIDLFASDVDGDALTYSIDTDVSNGILGAISDNHVTYTPNSGYMGSDSFTFKANDGTVDSNIATINITVNPPPVISNEANNTPSENSVTITWSTDHPSTSRVIYDTVSHAVLDVAPNYGYANSTVETDTSPKVVLHSVTISGLVAGTTYYYRVVSHGSPEVVGDENTFTTKSVTISGGEVAAASTTSSTSSVCSDQKPGSAPTLISIISSGLNEVTLTWAKAKDPVTYYLIAFGTKPGEMLYGNPFVGGKDTTSYTVKGLSSGTRYYFKIRAGNNCMPGDFSNELSAVAYGEELNEIPEGFSPGVLGTETTAKEKVLGKETASPTTGTAQIFQGGGGRRNLLIAGVGIILLAAGYYFFVRRKRE